MCHLLLAEADAGIAKSKVFAVIFTGRIKVGFSLHIIALALRKQESVLQMPNIERIVFAETEAFCLERRVSAILAGFVKEPTEEQSKIDYLLQNIEPFNFFSALQYP